MSQVYLGASHPAIDLGATAGTSVYAFADGKVSFVQSFSGNWSPYDSNPPYSSTSMQTMGNCIVINHDNPNKDLASGDYARTIYMHLKDAPSLSKGDEVHKGDLIGYIGNTGRSSDPHLHFALAVGNSDNMVPICIRRTHTYVYKITIQQAKSVRFGNILSHFLLLYERHILMFWVGHSYH